MREKRMVRCTNRSKAVRDEAAEDDAIQQQRAQGGRGPVAAAVADRSASPVVLECICSIKIGQVHITASECLLDMINLYKAVPVLSRRDPEFKGELINLCEVEKNAQAKTTLRIQSTLCCSIISWSYNIWYVVRGAHISAANDPIKFKAPCLAKASLIVTYS
ncbi:hypothetical protein Syun_001798 [Stephania yunnanensis]|uniref:Uncharacterized protein n=1 Tax=Stephania yunnanensis TaxID=152371 RepID=A0AAP0Q7G3_9MAGN